MGKGLIISIIAFVLINIAYADFESHQLTSIVNPFTGTGDIVRSTNQTGVNWTADYFFGQPLDGSIVSGVIYAEEHKLKCGCLNITENDTHVTYPEHKGRVWNLNDLDINYCNLSGATVLPTDNQHSVYYVDSSCTLQSMTWVNYFGQNINPSNYYRLFDVYKVDGLIELIKGSSLIGILPRKVKWNSVNCRAGATHLTVCEGITIEEGTFPYFNQTSGSFIYVATEHTSAKKQTNVNGIHFVTYESGDLKHLNQTGMNLTHCTDGTDTTTCSSPLFYRHYIYTIGIGVVNTQIHELAPRDDEYFTTLANCMNFMENPHTYIIPDLDTGVAVLYSVYCGRKGDTDWNDAAWYDMRDEKRVSGAGQDTSDFMRYSGWSQNADANSYNLTNVGLNHSLQDAYDDGSVIQVDDSDVVWNITNNKKFRIIDSSGNMLFRVSDPYYVSPSVHSADWSPLSDGEHDFGELTFPLRWKNIHLIGNITDGTNYITLDYFNYLNPRSDTGFVWSNIAQDAGLFFDFLSFGDAYDDNNLDLGGSGVRFKDLYLAGSLTDGTNSLTVANARTAYDFSQGGHNNSDINVLKTNVSQITHSQNITNPINSSWGIFNNGSCIVIGDLSYVSEC